jgi:hypothetical protein
MQTKRPGAPVIDEEVGSSASTGSIECAGDFQKARTDKYIYDPDDWANHDCYKAKIYIVHIAAFGTMILAIAELIHLSPAQVAYDYLNFPLDYYMLNTYFGLTAWFSLILVNAALALGAAITAWARACGNSAASRYNRTAGPGEKVSLPYPPLSWTGWFCFWNLAFWASDIGWMSRLYWIGTNFNIVEQAFWFTNIWWYTIICAMFTCLPGILHHFRQSADMCLAARRSTCFDC